MRSSPLNDTLSVAQRIYDGWVQQFRPESLVVSVAFHLVIANCIKAFVLYFWDAQNFSLLAGAPRQNNHPCVREMGTIVVFEIVLDRKVENRRLSRYRSEKRKSEDLAE